jgi:anti-sigma factor RsiW
MTNTKVDDVLLVAYVDGEIAPAAARQIEAMMALDESLAERVAMFRRSAGMLKLAFPESEYEDVPPRLLQTIQRHSRKDRMRNWRAVLLPLAASVAGIAIGVGSFMALSHGTREAPVTELANLLSEVGEYHSVFAAESEHLVEVPAARKDHLEAWLSQRVHLPLKAPDLTALKLAFAGGRMLVVNGLPVAQLIYVGDAGQRVALCVGQLKTPAAAYEETKKADDLVLVGKVSGNHMFVVAGPAGDPVVDVLAKHVPQLLSRS